MKINSLLRRTALLCTLATGGALAVAPPAQAQFAKISEQEEIDAGRQAKAQAEKEYGRALSQSDPRQQRVNRIGAMFARQASRRNIPYSYTVLQNDKVLNAFAAPGGPIFVTTKLISTTANDAELAFVLGHETGHIEHRDVVKSVEKQQQVGLGIGILGAILGGGGGSGNVIGTISNVGFTLWQKGFSRGEESDADDYGVHAMSRLGFDPRAAVSMMGKLGDGGNGIGKYLSDHPTSDSRVKKLTEIIRKDNLEQVAQRNGGFLNLSGGSSNTNYYPNNHYRNDGSNGGDVYPPTNNQAKYPTSAPNPSPERGRANGSIGLRVVQDGKYRVVLASASDMARYAGGNVERRGRDFVVSRGNSYAIFTPGLKTANVNGRRVKISAKVQQSGGDTFAPIGTLADALDGNATYDSNRRGVRLDFAGGPSAFVGL